MLRDRGCEVKVTFIDVLSSFFPYSQNVLLLFQPLFFIKAVLHLCQSHDCYVCRFFCVSVMHLWYGCCWKAESLFDIAHHHTHMPALQRLFSWRRLFIAFIICNTKHRKTWKINELSENFTSWVSFKAVIGIIRPNIENPSILYDLPFLQNTNDILKECW